MSSSGEDHLSDARIAELLTWERAFEAAERALESLSSGDAQQSSRVKLKIGDTSNSVFIMGGFLRDEKYGGLVSLLFTQFIGNRKLEPPLPVVNSEITLMDENTGVVKTRAAGRELVRWVLPSVSVIATKYLYGKTGGVLAVIGTGNQGRLHAIAMQKYFNFSEVRLWNRTSAKANDLMKELNKGLNEPIFVTTNSVEECLKNADVIVTATNSSQTLVKYSWIKPGAHVNAIGVSVVTTELDADTYRACKVYSDSKGSAQTELKPIVNLGVKFEDVGDVIVGKIPVPAHDDTTIFQSSGTAIQYSALLRLVYDLNKVKQ